jgi:hypothetical protein
VTERELFDLMTQAAWRATQVCRERGLGLGDRITKDSARAAAEEVYREHRPEEFAPAPAPALVVPEEPVYDPRSARMEREPGEEPF